MSGYWQAVLTPVLLEAIAVAGLYVAAMAGRISVAQASFMGIGSYAGALVAIHLTDSFAVLILVGALAGALVGVGFAWVADRLDHWFFAVATLAFGLMVTGVASSTAAVGGATGLYGVPLQTSFGIAVLGLVATMAVVIWVQYSPLGQRIRSVRDSAVAAAALGINPRRIRVIAFTISSGIAGFAGALYVSYLATVKPSDTGFDRSLLLLVYLAVGGTRSWLGPLVGTFVLGVVPEVLRFSRGLRLVLFGVVLALVMVTRPTGIMGSFDPIRWLRNRRLSGRGGPPRRHAPGGRAHPSAVQANVDQVEFNDRAVDG